MDSIKVKDPKLTLKMKKRVPEEHRPKIDRNLKYRKELLALKARVTDFFDQMIAFDVNLKEDREKAEKIAQRHMRKIHSLCKEHLNQRLLPLQEEPQLDDLTLTVDQIEELEEEEEEDMIGDGLTFVGLKNHTSYLIWSNTKGMKLVENNVELYSAQLPKERKYFWDAVYTPSLNCYLMPSTYTLYRKDIDDKPPYLFMDVNCGGRMGSMLQYAKTNHRFIISREGKTISLLNPKTKKLEVNLKKGVGRGIQHFKPIGMHENRVIAVTYDGFIVLFSLGYSHRRGLVSYLQIAMDQQSEEALCFAVCPKGEYLFVGLGDEAKPQNGSRLVISKLIGDSLIISSSINQFGQCIQFHSAFECFGNVGKHIILVGLIQNDDEYEDEYEDEDKDGFAVVYDFDTGTEEFRELQEKRVNHEEVYPVKIDRVGDKLYYTGFLGQLMSLSLTF